MKPEEKRLAISAAAKSQKTDLISDQISRGLKSCSVGVKQTVALNQLNLMSWREKGDECV